ncbi:hypothetical protein LXA43DRAFT_1066511 [Ganoderma leucocontextum]|nr:hypothetical protein LXA43DRAFT_1066511 [Ganoderma leucocontextum]
MGANCRNCTPATHAFSSDLHPTRRWRVNVRFLKFPDVACHLIGVRYDLLVLCPLIRFFVENVASESTQVLQAAACRFKAGNVLLLISTSYLLHSLAHMLPITNLIRLREALSLASVRITTNGEGFLTVTKYVCVRKAEPSRAGSQGCLGRQRYVRCGRVRIQSSISNHNRLEAQETLATVTDKMNPICSPSPRRTANRSGRQQSPMQETESKPKTTQDRSVRQDLVTQNDVVVTNVINTKRQCCLIPAGGGGDDDWSAGMENGLRVVKGNGCWHGMLDSKPTGKHRRRIGRQTARKTMVRSKVVLAQDNHRPFAYRLAATPRGTSRDWCTNLVELIPVPPMQVLALDLLLRCRLVLEPLRTYAGSILRPTLLILTGFPMLAPLAPLGLPRLRPTPQPVPVPTVRNSWYNGTLAIRPSLSAIFPAGTQHSASNTGPSASSFNSSAVAVSTRSTLSPLPHPYLANESATTKNLLRIPMPADKERLFSLAAKDLRKKEADHAIKPTSGLHATRKRSKAECEGEKTRIHWQDIGAVTMHACITRRYMVRKPVFPDPVWASDDAVELIAWLGSAESTGKRRVWCIDLDARSEMKFLLTNSDLGPYGSNFEHSIGCRLHITMLRQTRSRAHKTAAPALNTARVELLICGWRIIRALEAFPDHPDELTVQRWNAGLAREAWRAIVAIGKITAMEMVGGPLRRPKCRPVEMLLEHAIWEGTSLRIDIMSMNRTAVAASMATTDTECAALAQAEFWWPAPQWWIWNENGDQLRNRPGWWDTPERALDSWLPLHDSDFTKIVTHLDRRTDQALKGMGKEVANGAVAVAERAIRDAMHDMTEKLFSTSTVLHSSPRQRLDQRVCTVNGTEDLCYCSSYPWHCEGCMLAGVDCTRRSSVTHHLRCWLIGNTAGLVKGAQTRRFPRIGYLVWGLSRVKLGDFVRKVARVVPGYVPYAINCEQDAYV